MIITSAPVELPPEGEPVQEMIPAEVFTPEPVETPIPMGEMINRYGVVNDKQVAVRSEQSKKSEKSVLARLNKGDHVYMLQDRINDNGDQWTAVFYEGRIAYMMSRFLTPMSQWESDAYMGEIGEFIAPFTLEDLIALETPAAEEKAAFAEAVPEQAGQPEENAPVNEWPETAAEAAAPEGAADGQDRTPGEEIQPAEETETPTAEPTATPTAEPTATPAPTPVETPIPQGEMINRFARTNDKSVNVRTEPNAKAKQLMKALKKGSTVYAVREEINSNGDSWTRVIINGKPGFIRTQFLDVMTQLDSDAYMATLNGTPVPPITAEELDAMETPEPEPIQEPVQNMAEEPVEVLTPEPTEAPTEEPTATPTAEPTATPTEEPTATPTAEPTATPTEQPTATPTAEPTATPTATPTAEPTATPTAEPTVTPLPTAQATAEPPQITGYAITIGDGAYVRNWPSSNSVIVDNLPANKVVFVNAQTYVDGVAWHQIQYSNQIGYVRADMLRIMNSSEVIQYLDQMKATPEPTAVITVQPYDPNSLSSYGYTTTTVNFRETASISSARLRQLKRYAFCLVLGTTEVNGETWYRVSYDGQNGYIKGDYFKQMSLAEMEAFLGSNEYLEGIASNAKTAGKGGSTVSESSQGGSGSGSSQKIVSAEDQKVSTWTNPDSGILVSYEPFDPFATPEPLATEEPNEYLNSLIKDVQDGSVTTEQLERLLTTHYQGAENASGLVADGLKYIQEQLGEEEPTATPEPSPSPEITATVEPETPQEETGGPGAAGWIVGIAAVLAAAGGGYAVYSNQLRKRQEAQAAARRKAAQARKQQTAGGSRTTAGTGGMTGSAAAGTAARRFDQSGKETAQTGAASARAAEPPAGQTVNRTAGPAAEQRKPYDHHVENPYGRYSTRNGDEDPKYTASFRPGDRQDGDNSSRRRRRSTSSDDGDQL